jgi:hypothetical protein
VEKRILHNPVAPSAAQSVLFLRIQAAASYYSTNRTLMEHPEPVDVDISTLRRHVYLLHN